MVRISPASGDASAIAMARACHVFAYAALTFLSFHVAVKVRQVLGSAVQPHVDTMRRVRRMLDHAPVVVVVRPMQRGRGGRVVFRPQQHRRAGRRAARAARGGGPGLHEPRTGNPAHRAPLPRITAGTTTNSPQTQLHRPHRHRSHPRTHHTQCPTSRLHITHTFTCGFFAVFDPRCKRCVVARCA
jgi:hypothetical protein